MLNCFFRQANPKFIQLQCLTIVSFQPNEYEKFKTNVHFSLYLEKMKKQYNFHETFPVSLIIRKTNVQTLI